MSEPSPASVAAPPCPVCSTPLTAPPGPDGAVGCPSCGRRFAADALAEIEQLTAWSAWAAAHAGWLRDRLAAGDLPATGWSALRGGTAAGPAPVALPGRTTPAPAAPSAAPTAAPAAHPARRPSPAGLLLAGGAALLVLAGIAFVAFAWDLLGPAGQVLTLYGLGVAVLAAGVRLRVRLPGTATTLAVVGALLVAVSTVALRVLGPDLVGETTAWLVTVAVAVTLAGFGAALRRRMAGAGETAALTGAALAAALVATAPADGALPLAASWLWWPAVTLLAAGVLLLVLAARLGVRTWPPLAAGCLFLGAVLLGGYAGETLTDDDDAAVVLAAVTLAAAPLFAALARLLPGRPAAAGAAAGGVAAVSVLTAASAAIAVADLRPWAAVVLAGAAGFVGWAGGQLPPAVRPAVRAVSMVVAGAAVGAVVAPWSLTFASWQGAAAGAAFAAVLGVLPLLDTAVGPVGWRGVGPVGAATSAVWLWTAAVLGDQPTRTDGVLLGLAAALLLAAVAGWVQVGRGALPLWAGWPAALAAAAGSTLLVVRADVPAGLGPEWLAVALAWGPAVAGVLCWRVRRPASTPTMLTVAPALTLLLAPTTWAMVSDATSRWWAGEAPGTGYQARVVALFVVGASLVVVGAWRRSAGVVVPAAAALLAVTVVQLVELGRFLPQWVSFGVAGAILVVSGARWESVRRLGREGSTWLRELR